MDAYDHLKYRTFEQFCDYFYSTDHHWNHRGSYQGYVDIVHMLLGEEEEILIENTETRDQPKNKERALKLLKSQLYDRAMKKRLEAQAKIEAGKKKIEWGSQIRSYVFDDKRVKDHRTNYQTSDVDGVMNGKIDDFIKAYLMEFPVMEE